ncbi:MAG: peptidyl-prolyl cis-trans isomerase [Candidatus Omnitrophota bacterium]
MLKYRLQNKLKARRTNTRAMAALPFAISALCLFLISCLGIWNPALYAEDKIIAVVNSDVITQKDLDDFINFMNMQLSRQYSGSELESRLQAVKQDLLNKLIEDRLILQEAKKSGIKIEESRIKARVNEIRRRYPSDREFKDDLIRQGLTQADVESKIKEQSLMYEIVEAMIKDKIVIRPEEVTNFYNSNTKEFAFPEERDIETIALENEDQAKSVSYSLKTGQKLADLAVRYPMTVNDLKVRQGEFRKEIESAVFKMNILEISNPVKIDNKYYIFKLNNIVPPKQQTLSEAQAGIHAFLFDKQMQERLAKWLDELRKKSYIKVLHD